MFCAYFVALLWILIIKLVNIKKLLISKRRIGILKNYLNKVKIVRVCDFIIFEIPILTVAESMINYIYIILTVKIGISNIIKSQTLTIFTLFR